MNLVIIEHAGERVLTTEQLAEAYECKAVNIRKNFITNADRFVEGKHYFRLAGEELKQFKDNVTFSNFVGKNANSLLLWTHRGASRHCKMLGTDKAWEMFDRLEETYFNPKSKQLILTEQMAQGLLAAKELLEAKNKQVKELTETCSQQQQVIGELKPKADYVDKILKSDSLVTITQIAKDYGMSGQGMNEVLHDLHIIYSCNKQWLLYSQHQAKGYTFSETVDIPREDGTTKVVMNTKWTQKGRLFLYETLKKRNLLPLIERKEQE